jgi:hypothetical protein
MYNIGHIKEKVCILIVKLSTIKDGMMVYRAQEDKGTKRKPEDDPCKDDSEQGMKSKKIKL